jgi:hypothetical protein
MDNLQRAFERARMLQITANRERTPTQRFKALCELLDLAAEMAANDPAGAERRRRAFDAHQKKRELWREQHRRFLAAHRDDAVGGT